MSVGQPHMALGPSRRVEPSAAGTEAAASQAARLCARHLRRILRLVDLRQGPNPRPVSAYRLRGQAPPLAPTSPAPGVRYEALLSYSRNEPRLELIQRSLQRLLRLGTFVADGAPAPIDGFRLRALAQWAGYPVPSLADNVGSISSFCNCDCEFCYEKGTRGAGIALGRAQLSLRETKTRLKYFSRERRTGLIPSSRFSLEPFANPRCLEILERTHEAAPGECTNLTTNGAFLTEEVVQRLARLRPILLTISMNAATVDLRLRTMRDHQRASAERALSSLALLRQYEIPFVASYVPWPSKPLGDLEAMVRLLDRHDGVVARVCLPSWTRYSSSEAPFQTEPYWAEILALVERLRAEVSIPIHLMPNMYQLRTMRPVVQGTIKHSPAADAGFRYGDLIVAIEGHAVFTRPEVSRYLARRFDEPGVESTCFTVQRAGERLDIAIPHPRDLDALRYPYKWLAQPGTPRTWAGSLGLHIADGFELTSFMRLKSIVEEYAGRTVLLFVSELGEAYFHEGMAMLGEEAAFVDRVALYVQTLRPRYWGGNVMIGDLWTTRDLIDGARHWIEGFGARPDVLIIPSSFLSGGGRDLLGRCYMEIERALDLEVRLLPCLRIGI